MAETVNSGNPTDPQIVLGGRYQSIVRCPHCRWGAKLTSAVAEELQAFLADRLAEHWIEQHPIAEPRM